MKIIEVLRTLELPVFHQVGSQGMTGSIGHTGPQGTQGYQGLQGVQGVQGFLGMTGSTGPQGTQGYQGYQGVQGVLGMTGPTGPQGTQGYQGYQGVQGVLGMTGPTGPQGTQGYQGYQGVQGVLGMTGPTGPQGTQGYQGYQGVQGFQGILGMTGPTGPQGTQGYQGPIGFTGPQGDADAFNIVTEELHEVSSELDSVKTTLYSKVDGAYAENGLLYLTSNGIPIGQGIEVGSGTGGGSGTAVTILIRISSGYSSTFAIAEGSEAILHYFFSSVYTIDSQETGQGQATYFINGVQKLVKDIQQGENTQDVSQYLSLGSNRIAISIIDSLGNGRTLQYTITVVSIGISSTFDYHSPITSSLEFRFTLTGGGEKTVHFVIDGEEIASVVSSWVNRQISQVIPMQTHGSHVLEVYATALVNGLTVSSNILRYDTIWFVSGNTDPIIVSQYINTTALLYETVQIPYIVYGSTSTSLINLKVDDVIINTLTVDRTEHIWAYRIMSGTTGSVKVFTIQCGDVTKTFNLTLSGSSIPIEAETSNLQLYLSSYGRSNSQSNKSEWKFESIESVLTDFNWSTDGWQIDDEGVTCLRILGDARVTIPLNIFATDARVNGKTVELEFSTHDISNEDSVILTNVSGNVGISITSMQATLSSQQSSMTTKFKDSEHIRLSFVIGRSSEYRLAYLYINAVLSQVIRYSTSDSFIQGTPVGFTIGSNDATIDLYSIRVYDNDLNQFQLVDNFIVDVTSVNQMLALYEKNAIFNEYGNLSYDLTCDKIPCMTLIGPLPTYKGDKKSVSITYENRQDSTKNFSAVCKVGKTNIDVQGTSSQYYPRKNYKISLDKSTVTQGGITLVGGNYKLRDDSIAVPIYTVKADFAEASGAHNTGMARMVDEILKDLGLLTPPQLVNENVRTTVDGFPIVIFHKATAESEPTFLGKYNFNTDKGSTDAYGFTDLLTHESWEFLNNTSPICLFRSDDFTSLDGEGNPAWLLDLEARYPDGFEDPTNLQLLWSWVLSCEGDSAKFKTECSQHFNVDFLISYYLITEIFGMVDQRAKNMFVTTWGNEGGANRIWYFIFYDNDTCLGINNEGVNVFDYNIEYHDPSVWNGESSLLWELVEEAFADEISAMYALMRQSEALTYDKVQNQLTTEQTDKWSESIYNLDGKYKYIDPGIEDGNWTYLYAAQGSRKEHRKYWLSNRLRYLDSKYFIGDYSDDFILMRLYTPEGVLSVPVNHDFSVDLYSSGYLRIKFGSYIVVGRGSQGETLVVPAPSGMTFNDTETIVYGASSISNLGSLAAKYAGSLDFSKATKLEEIIIGSTVSGYDNPYLGASGGVLNIGNNTLLKIIDIRNCSALTAPLDVSGCSGIKEIYATGSGISTVVLPSGGNLEKMYLPATITNLTIRNQAKLTLANLTLTSKANILALWLENTPLLDIWAFYLLCVNVAYIRLIGVNIIAANGTAVYESLTKGGISELGNYIPTPVVTGDFFATEIAETHYNAIVAAYPELNVTYGIIDLVIQFADSTVKSILLSKGIGTGGEITSKQASLYTNSSFGYSSSTYWFKDNTSITSFDELKWFTNSITLYSNCFSGCTNLLSIEFPENIKLNSRVFYNTGITSLHIKLGVSNFNYTFFGMEKLTTVTFAEGKTLSGMLNSMFNGCISLEEIVLPGIDLYNGVKSIHSNMFMNCSKLHTITIPDDVTLIADEAFSNCTLLKNLIGFGSVDTVGRISFRGSGIESLDSMPNLSIIGSGSFENCKSLVSADLSNASSLGESIFSGCSKLHTITIPDDVTLIANQAFYNCTLLKNLIGFGSVDTVGASSFRGSGIESLNSMPNLSIIGNMSFENCKSLVSVDLSNVSSLGESIFSGCSSLESAILPQNITEIPKNMFSSCILLSSVNIPDTVLALGNSCFSGCTNLFENTVLDLKSISTVGYNVFTDTKLKGIYGPNVTSILGGFSGSSLETVNLPLITSLNNCNFNSSNLIELLLPEVQSISFTGTYFLSGTKVVSLYFPKLVSLNIYQMSNNTLLESVDFPMLETWSFLGFSGCTSLSYVNIPKITELKSNCFSNCISLMNIDTSNISIFGNSCFDNVGFKNSTTLPIDLSNAVTFESSIFYYFKFSSIELPSTVTSIGGYCFYGCTNLVSFTCLAEVPPTLGSNAFTNTNASLVIYVPAASVDAYKEATNWSTYASKIQAIS